MTVQSHKNKYSLKSKNYVNNTPSETWKNKQYNFLFSHKLFHINTINMNLFIMQLLAIL